MNTLVFLAVVLARFIDRHDVRVVLDLSGITSFDGDGLEAAGKRGLQAGNAKNNWSRAGHGDPHARHELRHENADQRVARGCILHLGVAGGDR